MTCPEETPERMSGIYIIVALTLLIYGVTMLRCLLC